MPPERRSGPPLTKAARDIKAPAGCSTHPTVQPAAVTGCPCGCRTWLPWIDDPECLRHRPHTARGLADALDHLDELGLCACWVGPRRHRRSAA
jgi:hypothetical protein